MKDAHALKGELYVLIFSGEWDWFDDLESFKLVSPRGEEQVLEFEKGRPHKDGLIIKPKEVNDRNASEKLKGWEFQIPEKLLTTEDGDTPYLSELQNFRVFDDKKEVGILREFWWNGAQDLLVVESASGEKFEIPFVDAFIVEVDYEAAIVYLQLPEGLLEINKKDSMGGSSGEIL
ncbi:MAG: ribosome maturation factor RimM [Pseudobdellovibrionaceae bacterium]